MFAPRILLATALLTILLPAAHAQESTPALQLNTPVGIIACQNGIPTLSVSEAFGGHIIPIVPTISYKSTDLEIRTTNERGVALVLKNEGGNGEFGFMVIWALDTGDENNPVNGGISMSFIAANKVCGV